MMIRAANLLAEARRIPGMAGTSTVSSDWAPVAKRIRDEATDNWDDRVAVERFEGKGGRLVRGQGRIVGPGRVAVGDVEIEAGRAIVVATGTQAVVPPIPGLAQVAYWTNREAVATEEVPASLAVLGGGAVGAELAQVFSRFGSRVTVIEALDTILAVEEPEASKIVTDVFGKEGIEVRAGVAAESASAADGGIRIALADGSRVVAERLLVATGRRADLRTLGLSSIGVDDGARWLSVDPSMRAAPGVWAVGDLTGEGAFTHMAMYQAGIAAADILGRTPGPADYRAVPRVTFTDPEVGSVGIGQAAALERGLSIRVGEAAIPSSSRGWIHKTGNEGLIKLVEDASAGVLVGATSVGPTGGEVLGLLTLAVHARVPVESLMGMIYAYPTFHRAVEAALADLHAVNG
jgi:pyruvate/2-oxoglutarate dehydrogenase complex dihydrolipoamide dehydrogenase (E3) component